ncbi:unnamed protein product [Moneuplotes crassus]|uniref:Homeobox domain-containing protein n=1 Tax=Euplotes crassus TaxID=5936 RepID=A0AAD1U2F0_EUPCR|nr:unnamed protein product [Moneuplotes crassus]
MQASTTEVVAQCFEIKDQNIGNELNQAFKGNTYKMSTLFKKRESKKRTKTLDEKCIESGSDEPAVKTSKLARKSTINKASQKKNPARRGPKTRRRKTADEINLLERAFFKDPEWTQITVDFIKKHSMLEYVQIYKWGWDQKKKIKRNPNLKRVPTIDEFGGYCKYDNSDLNLLSLCGGEDLNHKVALLDQESEKLDGPLPQTTTPGKLTLKRRKTVDFENFDRNFQNQDFKEYVQSNGDDFAAPSKKIKRNRYCSDLTNVTRSPALSPSINELRSRAFFEEETPSEKMAFCYVSENPFEDENSLSFLNLESNSIDEQENDPNSQDSNNFWYSQDNY